MQRYGFKKIHALILSQEVYHARLVTIHSSILFYKEEIPQLICEFPILLERNSTPGRKIHEDGKSLAQGQYGGKILMGMLSCMFALLHTIGKSQSSCGITDFAFPYMNGWAPYLKFPCLSQCHF